MLALEKSPLLALVGLTRVDKPEETIPYVMDKIHRVADLTLRKQLLTILISLTEDEEIVAMIESLLESEDELLIDTPFLRRMRELGQRESQAEGRAEGRAEGLVDGQLQGAVRVLERLLSQRFGDLPLWVHSCLQQAHHEQVEAWSLRVLEALRLEKVFEE